MTTTTEPMDWKVDREGWPPGPWDGEPDRVDFRAHGLPCLLLRSDVCGTWCGYVGVPLETRVPRDALNVHGGVNYEGPCSGVICHVPEPGESDEVYWYGFDCADVYDLMPRTADTIATLPIAPGRRRWVYRDVSYARAETEQLAEQLAEILRGG